MTPERWQQIQSVFEAALEIAPGDRDRYLASACGEDRQLRAEVESLLSADATRNILDGTAARALGLEAEPTEIGRVVGAYRLVELLGTGGMGEVFSAERADGQFEQRVAVKLLRPDVSAPHIARRFAAERQILANMEHPNIARLYDGGVTEDGRSYFVMEYIDGAPIVDHCEARGLDVEARLSLLSAACSAVELAHGRMVIHRDLKPDNILVTADGTVKLLDFGIAKVIDPDQATAATDPRLRMMTPQYAAPEQVRGEAVTAATDVYALGVILYQLITGRLPYDVGDVRLTKLASHIETADIALPSQVAGCDRRLDAVCARALAKSPGDRYGSVAQLREAIDRVAAADPERRRRNQLIAACVACLIAGAALSLGIRAWLN